MIFSKNRPLGRFFLRVAMSVYILYISVCPLSLSFFSRPLIGPQITGSDPGLSLVDPPPPCLGFSWGFPGVCPGFSQGFPRVFPSFSQGFPGAFLFFFTHLFLFVFSRNFFFFLITQFPFLSRNHSKIVSVLLSALVERFFVSRMRDFFLQGG